MKPVPAKSARVTTGGRRLQNAARNSTEWFENIPRYINQEPMQVAYSLLTRSQRVSHENLRLRDQDWLEEMERWLAERSFGEPPEEPVPPMFTPFRLRRMELMNRVRDEEQSLDSRSA